MISMIYNLLCLLAQASEVRLSGAGKPFC